MKQIFPLRTIQRRRGRNLRSEAGSMLLILLIFLAVFIIVLGTAAPKLAQQVKRDREIEMIHRGEQYARAIKRYAKKTGGQYPTRIEQLENTNGVRFIRKRYKDPMSPDGEWKLLHFGEVQLGQAGGLGSVNPSASQPQSLFRNSNSSDQNGTDQQSSNQQGLQTSGGSGMFGNPIGGQTFGGGPIIGVASKSEKTGIHEFNNKKKYNQWFFVYDRQQDRGAACTTCVGVLIKGPYNPKAMMGTPNQVGTPVDQMNQQTNTNDQLRNPTQPVPNQLPNR